MAPRAYRGARSRARRGRRPKVEAIMNKMLQVGAASGGPPCGTDGGGGRDEVAAAPRPDSSAAERIVDVVDSKAAIRRWLGEAAPLRQDAVALL
jgi:hypothetical protein